MFHQPFDGESGVFRFHLDSASLYDGSYHFWLVSIVLRNFCHAVSLSR